MNSEAGATQAEDDDRHHLINEDQAERDRRRRGKYVVDARR